MELVKKILKIVGKVIKNGSDFFNLLAGYADKVKSTLVAIDKKRNSK